MKIEKYQYPHSSFLSVEKDAAIIVEWLMKNKRLQKMLWYQSEDCLEQDPLTPEQVGQLFGDYIRIVPKIQIDSEVKTYIVIVFDNFVPNDINPQFRDNTIRFDIVCHFDTWQLKDFELRPFKIAAEIDSMFNNKRLTGIGTLQFAGAKRIVLNNKFAGISLFYDAIHGGEDNFGQPNPANEEQFREDFNELFNAE